MKIRNLLNYLLENEKYEVKKRSHMSSNPIEEIRDVPISEQPESGHKPKGFWYDCNNEWSEWVEYYQPDWKGDHIYQIQLDHSKMKVITNREELNAFSEKYRSANGLIDWRRVARDYSGIEICPYIGSARMSVKWYYDWDVASGCIWNKKAIKSIKKDEM